MAEDRAPKPCAQIPVRVLHFMWSGEVGGAQRAIYQLVRSQREAGGDPAVAFARASGEYYDRIRDLGIRTLNLGYSKDYQIWPSLYIKHLIAEFPIHHFHSPEITLAAASAMTESVRVYTHRSGDSGYKGRRRVRYALFGSFVRWHFNGLAANSHYAAKIASDLFGIPLRRWEVVYNGLYFNEVSAERPREIVLRELGLRRKPRQIIATMCSLRSIKRVDRIVRALQNAADNDQYLLVIGDGPERDRLVRLAAELGVSRRMIITGMKRQPFDYLQLADVFVLASSAESFGNAAVEAMALGIPTIVFADGGGLLEHVRHEDTGLIVRSSNELADTLTGLMRQPEMFSGLGSRARSHVRSRYGPEQMVSAYFDVYSRACESAHGET